jgi:glucose/arabinose dehydrogenase
MAIVGDGAANLLKGTLGSDSMAGFAGNDTILARSGSDSVFGGGGDDRLSGGEGSDHLAGGEGNDVIFGFGSEDRFASSGNIEVEKLGSASFDRPIFACPAPGDPGRLFVVEQHTGKIVILDTTTGAVNTKAFLNIAGSELTTGGEQGLLGLAFDPGYETNRKFYVYLTNAAGDIEVRAYRRSLDNPDAANPMSGNVILTIDKDNGAGNHNGGWIGFGPDGMLYIAVGDEGLSGDPANNAQNKNVLWGKILRIGVDSDGFASDPDRDYSIPDDNPFVGKAGAGEIWALGLRNPWRDSFDRLTGDFYIGDVGQGEREEIDFQPAGSVGGANYGWKVKEGTLVFDDGVPGNPAPDSPQLTDPVVDYGHDSAGGFAVVGGYVYRGSSPGMQGRYVYTDFVSGRLWSFRIVDGKAVDVTDHTKQLVDATGSFQQITSFAEDGHGNLYALSINGDVMRLDFAANAGDGSDLIDGGAGNDRLYGGAGDDSVNGGTDNDSVFGGGQDDVLKGGAGDDLVRGGTGNDTISGGSGHDMLSGGLGSDRFRFNLDLQDATITDFRNNVDTIVLANSYGFATAAEALSFAENSGGDVVFTFAGGQSLTVLGATKSQLADDLVV